MKEELTDKSETYDYKSWSKHTTAIQSPATSKIGNSHFPSPRPSKMLNLPLMVHHRDNSELVAPCTSPGDGIEVSNLNECLKSLELELQNNESAPDRFANEGYTVIKAAEPMETEEDISVPTLRWCAHCTKEIPTQVLFKPSSKTFWSSVGIFLTGGALGCFLIPYVSESCQSATIVCSKCQRSL